MKIAILGLSCNPPTIGHTQIAQFVLKTKNFDEVWLMPSYRNIFNKELESSEHRLNMCKLALSNYNKIKVFDYEIRNKLNGETFKFVNLLKTDPNYNYHDFSLIIGLDNANIFHQWKNYEKLEKLINFIVVGRKGVKKEPSVDWYLKYPHIFLEDNANNIIEISSTMVRKLLKEKDSTVERYINKDVYGYILKNNLYNERKEN